MPVQVPVWWNASTFIRNFERIELLHFLQYLIETNLRPSNEQVNLIDNSNVSIDEQRDMLVSNFADSLFPFVNSHTNLLLNLLSRRRIDNNHSEQLDNYVSHLDDLHNSYDNTYMDFSSDDDLMKKIVDNVCRNKEDIISHEDFTPNTDLIVIVTNSDNQNSSVAHCYDYSTLTQWFNSPPRQYIQGSQVQVYKLLANSVYINQAGVDMIQHFNTFVLVKIIDNQRLTNGESVPTYTLVPISKEQLSQSDTNTSRIGFWPAAVDRR